MRTRSRLGWTACGRYYEYSGSPNPEAVLSYFRAKLPPLGWRFDGAHPRRRAPNDEGEGREVYRKRIAGKQVTYVVAAYTEAASVELFTFYDTGLIGG